MNTQSHPARLAQALDSTHAAGNVRGWRVVTSMALLLMAAPASAVQVNLFFTPQVSAQQYTVPYDLTYTFVIAGGGGGDFTSYDKAPTFGGLGAFTTWSVFEPAGTTFTLQVGQRGVDGNSLIAGGGGAATVVKIGSNVQAVAGGGGGGAEGGNGLDASRTPFGTTSGSGAAGAHGTGGGAGSTTYLVGFGYRGGGGGGAGISYSGISNTGTFGGGGGTTAPAIGGHGYVGNGAGGSGGIAGGGGGLGGGGGGGYSGGAGGDAYSYYQFPVTRAGGLGGGGGGSLNIYGNEITASNPGRGYVLISYDYVAPPPVPFPTPMPAVPEPNTWWMMLLGICAMANTARLRSLARAAD